MNKKQLNSENNMVSDMGSIIPNRRQNKLEYILSFLPINLRFSKPVVAIFRLDGVIGKTGGLKSGLTICSLNKLIEKMFKIDNLEAVCLCINSPGGSPVQSELIASRIIELGQEKEIPIFSFVEDVAASGGYWLACAGEKIYASKSSIIGSIGVVSRGFGFTEAIKKLGIERRVYTKGENKSVLDPFKPVKNSDIELIGKIQQEIHQHFIDTVKQRRAGHLTQSDNILFNGEFWTGEIALDYGLIDGIETLYSFLNKRYGNNVKVEYVENKQSWFKKKLGIEQINKEFANELSDGIVNAIEKKLLSAKFDLD